MFVATPHPAFCGVFVAACDWSLSLHTHTHTTAYGPPKGGSSSYLSPVDSAIGSGVTSGVTTKAHSVVGGDDLEKFEDEEQLPPAYPYQSYSEQQSRGEGGAGQSNILGMPTMMHALKMSIRRRRCVHCYNGEQGYLAA